MTRLQAVTMAALCLCLCGGLALAGPPRTPLFGLYKAVVINNVDPQDAGRVQIALPSVPGFPAGVWAAAATPGSPNSPAVAPAVGSEVWVKFQGGDPSYPVWAPRQTDVESQVRPAPRW